MGRRIVYTTLNQRLTRAFGATRLALTDRLKAIVGFNWAEYHRDGVDNTETSFDQTERELSPYAGLTFDFTDKCSATPATPTSSSRRSNYDITTATSIRPRA